MKTGRAEWKSGTDAGETGSTGGEDGEAADGDSGSCRPDVPSSQLVRRAGAQFSVHTCTHARVRAHTHAPQAHYCSISNVYSVLIILL